MTIIQIESNLFLDQVFRIFVSKVCCQHPQLLGTMGSSFLSQSNTTVTTTQDFSRAVVICRRTPINIPERVLLQPVLLPRVLPQGVDESTRCLPRSHSSLSYLEDPSLTRRSSLPLLLSITSSSFRYCAVVGADMNWILKTALLSWL